MECEHGQVQGDRLGQDGDLILPVAIEVIDDQRAVVAQPAHARRALPVQAHQVRAIMRAHRDEPAPCRGDDAGLAVDAGADRNAGMVGRA
jgi:hypothetical protein